MEIGDKWKVESDAMNVTVSRKQRMTNRKTGIPYDAWINEAYFATVKGALTWILDQRIRETNLKDLKSVVKEIESAKTEILKAIKEEKK